MSEHGPEMAENQHDEAVNAASTRLALVGALHYWETSGCDCCSPTVCDDAIDLIGYDVAFWERMRRFGIELAGTAQNVIDQEQVTDPMPADLVAALRDPTITVPRDHEITLPDGRSLFEHMAEWRNAPSNTASAD